MEPHDVLTKAKRPDDGLLSNFQSLSLVESTSRTFGAGLT